MRLWFVRFVSGLLGALLVVGCVAPIAALSPTKSDVTVTSGATVELTVFAAASLTDSFTAIGQQFDAANPGTKVTFNFAGSNAVPFRGHMPRSTLRSSTNG